MPGGMERLCTLHTERHLQSESPCLQGEQAEGLQVTGEGQHHQRQWRGERTRETVKRPGFLQERQRDKHPFSQSRSSPSQGHPCTQGRSLHQHLPTCAREKPPLCSYPPMEAPALLEGYRTGGSTTTAIWSGLQHSRHQRPHPASP